MPREQSLISESQSPLYRMSISQELQNMGLKSGDLVLMHCSMGRLGWVCGAEQAVISGVLDVLGPTGTLVTPGFSSQLSDPGNWNSPPVPDDWVVTIRDNMPVFDTDKTPTRGMGRVVEGFRKWPGTSRSFHPVDSFLANGPLAREILGGHPLAQSLGPNSPLGKLYDRDARVLLLGAEYGSCTSYHLAEYELPGVETEAVSMPKRRLNGRTQWETVQQAPTFEERFAEIGSVLDEMPDVVTFGFSGRARLFAMSTGVGTARKWLNENLPETSA